MEILNEVENIKNLKINYIATAFLLISTMLMNGCASVALTFVDNSDKGAENNIYIGTRSDFKTVAFKRYKDGKGLAGNIFAFPFALIDLPLSVVADTLFLPYTLYVAYSGDEKEELESNN